MELWPLQKAYYRTFQAVFNIGARCLPWRKAERVEGAGAVGQIPKLLKREGANHPLVVTGPSSMRTGVTPSVLSHMRQEGLSYELYDAISPDPKIEAVEALVALYQSSGCDSLLAIGGGSPMDAAKCAAARIVRPKKTVAQLGGLLKVHRRLPPFIAVPTTAGTGSETTIAAVVTDSQTHHKFALMDLCLIPRYAVLDPELTLSLPPHLTATTGMDALTHAVEAYLCWTYNTKESLLFAEQAVKTILNNLEQAYLQGSDISARMNMLTASYQAGFAFTRAGVGNVHAIAHTLGGLYGTPHGLANAVLLPIVLEDYGQAVHTKLARLADSSGIADTGTTESRANAFIEAIRRLNACMGIPKGFDFIQEKDIPQIVSWALAETNPIYPVPVLYNPARIRAVVGKARMH